MARVFTLGFELNSITNNMEFIVIGSPTISSATFRSGAYAGRISSLTSATPMAFRLSFGSSNVNGPFYARGYFLYSTLPSAANNIFSGFDNSGNPRVWLSINSSGQLQLNDEDGTIGSVSSALSSNTWYRLELFFDRTPAAGSHAVEARIDGTTLASASNRNISTGISSFNFGGNLSSEAQTTGDWFWDDIAVNNTTGSFQNSWPGDGKVVYLRPNASGDSNTFSTQTGGTAGSSNNFTRINETTPDDATTFNGSTTLNEEDLFNVENSGLTGSDTITLVQVGGRFRNNTADAVGTFVFEAEKTSGGTVSQSSNIIPNTTTWNTNATAAPRSYPITLYQDPDSVNWTNSTVDSMQIGYKYVVDGTNRVDISAVWALVEFNAANFTTSTSSTSSSTSSSISTSSTSTSQSTSTSVSTSSTSTSASTSTSQSTSISTSSTSVSMSTSSTSSSTSRSTSTSSTSQSTSTSVSTSLSTSTSSTSVSTSVSTSISTSSTSTSTSSTSTSTSSTTTLPPNPQVWPYVTIRRYI